ncbi:YkvA family protein [Stappia indica]|uniref:YkvA family protein n=1 Tax=Stappia indica TaxID=538381 RepID=UPI00082D9164|nr:DUF1232 domain-containing protein [Stappia indica]
MLPRLVEWARQLKRDIAVLAIALRDPQAPLVARLLAAIVVAYALSPVDLIPDFIPVLGLLDDLILVPVGLWLVLRLMPDEVLARARDQVDDARPRKRNWIAGAVIVCLWLALAIWAGRHLLLLLRS